MPTIVAGTKAPVFEAVTFDGRHVDLSKMKRKKTWLCFYRYANCPLCHHHLFEISQKYEELGLGKIQICAVFESQRLRFGKLQDRRFPQFPMISDPKGALYELYSVPKKIVGVFKAQVLYKWLQATAEGFLQGPIDGPIARIPAHFLIQEDLTIHTAFYGQHIADHIPWDTVENFVSLPAVSVPETEEEKRSKLRAG